jgi:hypothetical protein
LYYYGGNLKFLYSFSGGTYTSVITVAMGGGSTAAFVFDKAPIVVGLIKSLSWNAAATLKLKKISVLGSIDNGVISSGGMINDYNSNSNDEWYTVALFGNSTNEIF